MPLLMWNRALLIIGLGLDTVEGLQTERMVIKGLTTAEPA
jgi:hypothetical protein